MKYALIILQCLFISYGATSALADGNIDMMSFQKEIAGYNRIKPLQDRRYKQGADILRNRISNNKSQVIGEVEDVLFNRNGKVSSLLVDFNRLKLGASVYLNYDRQDIQAVSSGYRLGFNSDEIEALYPTFLSNIETALGEEGDFEVLSLQKIMEMTVIQDNGQIIGEIQDVIFDKKGAFVQSIYLEMNYKMLRHEPLAIPLSVMDFIEKNGKAYAVIKKEYVNSIIETIKER